MNRLRFLSILIILPLLVFHFSNKFTTSNLSSKEKLAKDLKTDPDKLYQWSINNEAPFKHRILFKEVVLNSYYLLSKKDNSFRFFYTYKAWSAVFYCLTILSFYAFLKILGFKKRFAYYGCFFMLFSTPFLVAYAPPIHTREDILGYLILLLGLICTVKRKPLQVLLLSVLGFLCRETLLILPLFYFFFAKEEKSWIRFGLPLLSISLYLIYRIVSGLEAYDSTFGLRWNLENLEQVLGFSFLSFGFLWLPYFHSLIRWKQIMNNDNQAVDFFLKSSPFILLLILVTTFLGGIFNEIRLLFLAFPWVITVCLNYYSRFFCEFIASFKKGSYSIFVFSSLIFFIIIGFLLINNINKFIAPSKYGISYQLWTTFTMIHLFLTIILLPIHIIIERTISMNEIR